MSALRRALERSAGNVSPIGLDQGDGVYDYFLGDPSSWVSNVPAFETVAYLGLYDGIDMYTRGQRDNPIRFSHNNWHKKREGGSTVFNRVFEGGLPEDIPRSAYRPQRLVVGPDQNFRFAVAIQVSQDGRRGDRFLALDPPQFLAIRREAEEGVLLSRSNHDLLLSIAVHVTYGGRVSVLLLPEDVPQPSGSRNPGPAQGTGAYRASEPLAPGIPGY